MLWDEWLVVIVYEGRRRLFERLAVMQCWWWDGWRGSMAGKIKKKKKIEAYYYLQHVWKTCCNARLVWVLEQMHFCTGGEMVGEDAWQRHCIECGFMQCNYNALPPTSTVQLFSLFNLFKFFLSRVFLCFSIMLVFKYHFVFPVICVGQLKDKSLKVGIVGIIIRWCVCAGSTTPTSRDPSQSRTLPQRESIRTQVIRIHIEATRQPTNMENDPIRGNILRTTNYTK